jgi:hypothetical protein
VLSESLFVPLGKLPNNILRKLAKECLVSERNILFDIPHPSGANQERINYFLGKKHRRDLSSRTNPDLLDTVRLALREKVSRLTAIRATSRRDK